MAQDIFDTISATPNAPTQNQGGGDIFDQVSSTPAFDPMHQFDNLPVNERPSVTLNEGSHPTYGAPQQPSVLSSLTRGFMKNSPIEAARTNDVDYGNQDKYPKPNPGENMFQYIARVRDYQKPREEQIAQKGTLNQMELPMDAALTVSGAAAPLKTAKALGMFTALDKGTSAVGLNPDKIENPNLRDAAQLTKFGVLGGLSGKLSDIKPADVTNPGEINQKDYNSLIDKHASIYRDILNPFKGTIKKVEIKSGKDLNDSFKLAAQEGLVIGKDEAGKIDTTGAINQLKQSVSPLYEQQNEILDSNPEKQFDLNELGSNVKRALSQKTKNASDLDASKAQVDNEINAEIERHGDMVNGSTLNMIKQGMWSKAYKPLEPSSNDTARQIGFAAKDAIEKAYPDQAIKETNAKIGKYLDLQRLLEDSHGKVIQKGKIGRYSNQIIGAVTGHASGFPGAEIIGGFVGGKVSDFMNDPTRITQGLSDKIKNLTITNPDVPNTTRPGTVTPEVMNAPESAKFSLNPFERLLPQPTANEKLGIPNIFSDRGNTPQAPIGRRNQIAPTEKVGEAIAGQRPPVPYEPGQEAIVTKPPQIPLDKITPEAKENAKDAINRMWYEKMTGQKLPDITKKAAIIGGATALGSMLGQDKAQAMSKLAINDKDAVRTILGEAEGEGLDSQKAHASAIRNRNTLQGAYGKNAVVIEDGNYYRKTPNGLRKISPKIVAQVTQAWKDSKNQDFSGGANHWFSQEDLQLPKVQRMIKDMKLIKIVNGTSFYREGK